MRAIGLLCWLGVLLLSVSGCAVGSKLATFTADDATSAAKMADAALDSGAAGRSKCYKSWATLGNAVAGAKNPGLFVGAEAGFEINATINSSDCQAVAGQVILWAMRHMPGGNLLP